MFSGIQFMKPPVSLAAQFTGVNYAPMFRKRFHLEQTGHATLCVCGLGFGYYYINGQKVSEDLLTAPVSNYSKTLWYNGYDVTSLLKKGENVIAVWCGNGWYNEDFPSSWDYDKAAWRDVPKCILKLEIDGQTAVVSDGTWKCLPETAIYFNALRSGEYFDARLYDANWASADYDDSTWPFAAVDPTPPKGVFRQCPCEPIREVTVYPCTKVIKTGEQKFVYAFEHNMSGYIRLTAAGREGQTLTIRYSEQLKDDNSRELNDMARHYPATEFMTDRFICSGKETVWSPKFTYHGFQYIEIEGIEHSGEVKVEAVFIHQDIRQRTEFECSDGFLNQLFRAGIISTYSNLHYQITDCPTREKLGWTNDAQASAEQILTNFQSEKLMEKWLQDIRDAMGEDGSLPGIIPTAGWGYHWGNGPVSDGVLFEIPHRLYLHTGNPVPLIETLPWFDRYLEHLDSKRGEDGFVSFGLPDWACPNNEPIYVPVELINAALEYRFCEIAALAAKLASENQVYLHRTAQDYLHRAAVLKNRIMATYLTKDGICTIHHQTAAALMIYYGMYQQLEPLKQQLAQLVEDADFHHFCGMFGLRRLFEALNLCGLQEYAYRVITACGFPGYRIWFDLGATSLWEYWNYEKKEDSKNHHMYSDVLSWMVKTILGIRQAADSVGFHTVTVDPYFFHDLEYAKGSCNTCGGKLCVAWEKKPDGIHVQIHVPHNMTVFFRGEELSPGNNYKILTQ